MSRGQALMEKVEEERRTVKVNATFRIRLDGSAVLTRDMNIPVDVGTTLDDIRENVLPRVAEDIRRELSITVQVKEIEFPEE